MCLGDHAVPSTKLRQVLGFALIVNWFDPSPILLTMMLPPSMYPISNENKLPTMFSIRFVSVGFWMCLNDCTSLIFEDLPCKNSWTCFLMYFRNVLLDRLQITMIKKSGTLARYMVIAAPKKMDLVAWCTCGWVKNYLKVMFKSLLSQSCN
jgi:hypothetical protein